jgi:hypothetical protein
MHEEQFIPGIFNYCDRWCERCPLTARCRVYAQEQAALSENPDIADPEKEAYWEYIAANFAEAMQMLQAAAAQMGIDLDELSIDDNDPEAERRRIEQLDFVRAARTYREAARTWLEQNRPSILEAAGRDVELGLAGAADRLASLDDAFAVVSWYLFQIEVKLQRAQYSRDNDAGPNDEDLDFASEQTNAAAKIALIGIERSLGAWHLLYQQLADHQDEIIDHMAALERARELAIQHFPEAPAFRRPGFDD